MEKPPGPGKGEINKRQSFSTFRTELTKKKFQSFPLLLSQEPALSRTTKKNTQGRTHASISLASQIQFVISNNFFR